MVEDKVKPELDSSLPASSLPAKFSFRVGASPAKTNIEGPDIKTMIDSNSFNTKKPEARVIPLTKASNEIAQRFAEDEAVPKADERPETSGQAMGVNAACDVETSTAGGGKEVIEVDAAESRKLEPLAETDKPATELADGTMKIRKKSKGGVVATPETTAAEKVWQWGICKGYPYRVERVASAGGPRRLPYVSPSRPEVRRPSRSLPFDRVFQMHQTKHHFTQRSPSFAIVITVV